jgi:DNA-binding response OmpR family regulator/DNA-binding CsgD family transcriptional regulator
MKNSIELIGEVTLLLVDDDADNRAYLVSLMVEVAPNMSVLVAKHGKQALKILSKKQVDIILLDWEMPEMNGLEFLQVIRQYESWKYIPTIMYTGAMTESLHLRDAMEYGAIDFLRKPAEPIELVARIRAALYQKQLEEQRRIAEQALIKQRNDFLEESNILLRKETNNYLLMLARKNEILLEIQQKCKSNARITVDELSRKIIRFVEQSIREDDYWEAFLTKLNQTDPLFVKQLTKTHPTLTNNEIKVCTLIRFQIDTKSIANLLQVSVDGVKKSRYRIRKKMDLPTSTKLDVYIRSL